MAEMKVFVINLDEQEKDTGCAWFEHTVVAESITSFFFQFMGVGFQIKIFLSFFGKSRKFNVMLQAVTGNVHDVVTLWIKQKFFRLLQ